MSKKFLGVYSRKEPSGSASVQPAGLALTALYPWKQTVRTRLITMEVGLIVFSSFFIILNWE